MATDQETSRADNFHQPRRLEIRFHEELRGHSRKHDERTWFHFPETLTPDTAEFLDNIALVSECVVDAAHDVVDSLLDASSVAGGPKISWRGGCVF